MDRKFLTLFGAALLAMAANAQSQQAGAPAEVQTGVQGNAGGNQAQASGNASTATAAMAQSNGSSATINDGTAINAALSSSIDSKKAKEGDEVTARTTEAIKSQGKTVVPKGTKLIGHVTRASARGRGDAESTLGIAFDKAVLKNGEEVPLSGSIQALASAQSATSATDSGIESMASGGVSGGGMANSGGGRPVGGVASTAGGAVGAVANTTGNVASSAGGTVDTTSRAAARTAGSTQGAIGGLNSGGQFTANSRGVFGLSDVNLSAVGSNNTQGSLISSNGKNVHLDSGTRLLIVCGKPSGNAAPAPSDAQKPAPNPGSTKQKNQ